MTAEGILCIMILVVLFLILYFVTELVFVLTKIWKILVEYDIEVKLVDEELTK